MNCAPCITRLFSGHLSRTGEGGFRYRISPLYQKSLFFTPNASENAPRTPGACFLHGAHIPYRRRPSPVPNATGAPDVTYQNPSKHYHPTQRPDQALHNHPVTTAVNHPASTPCHHSYTPNPQHPQPPQHNTKEVPTECYFNRDFRKAAAAYSPTWWGSTIGASELNFSVRYGKRWVLTAITAAVFYLREISWSEVLAYSKDLGLLVQVD